MGTAGGCDGTDTVVTFVVGVTSLAVVAVTSPMSGGSRRVLWTLAYSSSTGDKSERSLSELQGSEKQNQWG